MSEKERKKEKNVLLITNYVPRNIRMLLTHGNNSITLTINSYKFLPEVCLICSEVTACRHQSLCRQPSGLVKQTSSPCKPECCLDKSDAAEHKSLPAAPEPA